MNLRFSTTAALTAALTAFVLLSVLPGANAQSAVGPGIAGPEWKPFGSLRVRQEFWDWFEPTGNFNNEYTFTGGLLRVGATRATPKNEATVELGAPFLLGLPKNAVAPAPQGPLGLGASYRAANGGQQASVFLKQGFYTIKSGKSAWKFGRQEFTEGAEPTTDPALTALKRQQVQQRLIGTFGWAIVGRSFDGVSYTSSRQANISALLAFPTQGVFELDGWPTLTDVRIAYLGWTRPLPSKTRPAEARLFGILYEDRRGGVVKTDNRPLPIRTADKDAIRLATLGGHYLQAWNQASGKTDFLVWGALQTGDWGTQNAQSWAGTVQAGWQPKNAAWAPWLRAGYFYASGDSDPSDNTHKTFYPLVNTPRLYSRTPFYAEANLQDLFGQVILRPNTAWTLRADFHHLNLASGGDLWYIAGGPFQDKPAFGLVGRPASGNRSLANFADLSVDWKARPDLDVTLYGGYISGKSVIGSIYPDKNSPYGYAEVTYRW